MKVANGWISFGNAGIKAAVIQVTVLYKCYLRMQHDSCRTPGGLLRAFFLFWPQGFLMTAALRLGKGHRPQNSRWYIIWFSFPSQYTEISERMRHVRRNKGETPIPALLFNPVKKIGIYFVSRKSNFVVCSRYTICTPISHIVKPLKHMYHFDLTLKRSVLCTQCVSVVLYDSQN